MTTSHVKAFLCAGVLAFATGVQGADSGAPVEPKPGADLPIAASHALMANLQRYLREQSVDVTQLSADAMVRLMIDWYRFTPVQNLENRDAGDALVYRYGGWSEGCATAFKLSLLRRVTETIGTQQTERLAGITLMFEPSNQSELVPFTAASSDAKSMDAFLRTIESSPAYKQLAGAMPMSVMIETGGVR